MRCYKCGMKLPDDSEFCQYCGTQIVIDIKKRNTTCDNSLENTNEYTIGNNENAQIDHNRVKTSFERLSAEQRARFFPGKEAQGEKVASSLVFLLGRSIDLDLLFEIYLTVASRVQMEFSDERIQSTLLMRYSSILSNITVIPVIRCIRRITDNYRHLEQENRTRLLAVEVLFDSQHRHRFAENEKRREDAVKYPGFGTDPSNPVYAHGTSSSYDYLNALYSSNFVPLTWDRVGSISVDGCDDLLYEYEIILPDGSRYCTVYINMYAESTSAYCPRGFQSIGLKQLPAENENAPSLQANPTGSVDNGITNGDDIAAVIQNSSYEDTEHKKGRQPISEEGIEKQTPVELQKEEHQVSIVSTRKDSVLDNDNMLMSPEINEPQEQISLQQKDVEERIVIVCKDCGRALPSDSKFCHYCGCHDLKRSEVPDDSVQRIRDRKVETQREIESNQASDIVPTDSSSTAIPVHSINTNEQKNTNPQEVNPGSGNDTKRQTAIPTREEPHSPKSTPDDTSEKREVSHSEQTVSIAEDAFFCKICGGSVDKRSRKCSRCGKQYFRVKRFLALLAIGFTIVALAGLNAFQYFYSSNSEQALKDEISEKNEQITSLVQRVSEKDAVISEKDIQISNKDKELREKDSKIKTQSTSITNLENEVSKLKTKADSFDEVCDAVKAGNLGYASSNFQTTESIVVVKKSQTNRKITLTANWSGGGTVEMSYSKSYPSAWIDFDNDSWYTSTTMTIDPNYAGVTVVTFSNDVDSKQFSIIIIVTD